MYIHRDLPFIHRFQQGGLSFWGGAVDFIGQQNIGEAWGSFELKLLLSGRIDGDTEYGAGQHVSGKLHALEATVQSARDGLSEGRLADARHAFDQQVAARK